MFEKQPAEFTQYTRFQHFTRCVHQKFCCAFTRMLVVNKEKSTESITKHFPLGII